MECYISVDVEASGPLPSLYSLLAIGACLVFDPAQRFYVELRPLSTAAVPEAARMHNLSLERLATEGVPPAEAMARFADWLRSIVPESKTPLFVGFNAAFDWMFVNDYFHRFLGYNPFGHAPLDVKSFYMGMRGGRWCDTSMRQLARRYLDGRRLVHHALEDALIQAELFRKLLAESRAHQHKWARSIIRSDLWRINPTPHRRPTCAASLRQHSGWASRWTRRKRYSG
ncbi:MAG: 3'-5' exonuclease [Anaerolineae bacterium]